MLIKNKVFKFIDGILENVIAGIIKRKRSNTTDTIEKCSSATLHTIPLIDKIDVDIKQSSIYLSSIGVN